MAGRVPLDGIRVVGPEALEDAFDPGFIDSVVDALERRNDVTLTVTERQIYLELNGTHLSSAIHTQQVAAG